jgi:hypothetical protein
MSSRSALGVVILACSTVVACSGVPGSIATPAERSSVVIEVVPEEALLERFPALEVLGSDPDVEVVRFSAAGRPGVRIVARFDDGYELPAVLLEGVDAGGRRFTLFERFELLEIDGVWRRAATARPLEEMVTAEPGSRGGADPSPPEVREDGTPAAELATLQVRLPGRLARSNAATVDGGVPRWSIAGGETRDVWLRTDPAGAPTAALLVAGLAIVAVLVLLARRMSPARRSRSTVEPGGADDRRPPDEPALVSLGPDEASRYPVPAWAQHPIPEEPPPLPEPSQIVR